MQRVLKRADRLQAAPCTLATVPCRMWGSHRSGGRAVKLIHEGQPARSQEDNSTGRVCPHSGTDLQWASRARWVTTAPFTSSHQTGARQQIRSGVKLGNPSDKS